ncbi:MAG: DUF4190 domain-containing protein [Thermoleophilia bacterium]
MADCTNHKGTEAVGICQGCKLPYCRDCLLETPDGMLCCRSCAATGSCMPRKQDPGGLAIASLVLSVTSFMFCITAVPGMVLGFVELSHIKKGESPEEGRVLALIGAIIGTIVTAMMAIGIIIFIFAIVVAGVSSA